MSATDPHGDLPMWPGEPTGPEMTFLAGEDVRLGDMLMFDRETGNRVLICPCETGWRDVIGCAARRIAKGESLRYLPNGNTADIIAWGLPEAHIDPEDRSRGKAG